MKERNLKADQGQAGPKGWPSWVGMYTGRGRTEREREREREREKERDRKPGPG